MITCLLLSSDLTALGEGRWEIIRHTDLETSLIDVCFVDEREGWAVGGNGLIVHTSDGGISWTKQNSQVKSRLNAVHFVNAREGWVVGEEPGVILHTSNGGENWEIEKNWESSIIDWGPPHLTDVFFIDEHRGWVTGWLGTSVPSRYSYPTVPFIINTKDGGITWTPRYIERGGREFLNGVYFINPLEGWAMGSGFNLHTTDGGDTWMELKCMREELHDMYFVNESEGWAVGSSGIILHTRDGGATWTRQESGTDYNLYSVHFINPKEGWIVGGEILHTSNGGKTWTIRRNVVHRGIFGVHFFNPNDGVMVGSSGIILHTDDGGLTFKRCDSSFVHLYGIDFVSPNEGWAVGRLGTVLHTTDGGDTWMRRIIGPPFGDFYDVDFIDSKKGWIVGTDGTVLHTKDGGRTWIEQTRGKYGTLRDVHFINDRYGWVVGNGAILHTNDGGETWVNWIEVKPELRDSWYKAYFLNPLLGWIVGAKGVFHTDDGGRTWTKQVDILGVYLTDVFFVNENEGWVVGESGVLGRNVILHTVDGGFSWREQGNLRDIGLSLKAIELVKGREIWAIGGKKEEWGAEKIGIILHTSDGGDTWTEQIIGTDHIINDICYSGEALWAIGDWGIMLKYVDESLNRATVNHPPEVSILAPLGGERWSGVQEIKWRATDIDGDELSITIEYRPYNEMEWHLVAEGEVNDGTYRWDTTPLEDSGYLIRIIAKDGALSKACEITVPFVTDNHLHHIQSGWPIQIRETSFYPPILGDLDGDGRQEVVIVAETEVYVFTADGKQMTYQIELWKPSPPALGDINGDGREELILASANKDDIFSDMETGIVCALDADANFLPGWPVVTDSMPLSPPSIGDVNNDGKLDIVIITRKSIYAWNGDGSLIMNFPIVNPDQALLSSPLNRVLMLSSGWNMWGMALGDIDNDGADEIIANIGDGFVHALNDDGSEVNGWPVAATEVHIPFIITTAIGDVDADGWLEVVSAGGGRIYLWNADGSLVPGWPKETEETDCHLALGDVDGDDRLEIFYGQHVYRGDGEVFLRSERQSATVIGDVNGDGEIEAIGWEKITTYQIWGSPSFGGIIIAIALGGEPLGAVRLDAQIATELNARKADGSIIGDCPIRITTPIISSESNLTFNLISIAMGDIDEDDALELIVPSSGGKIYCVDMGPGTYNSDLLSWPMIKRDAHNSGCLPRKRFTLNLSQGINLISVPLNPRSKWRLSDLAHLLAPELETLIAFQPERQRLFAFLPDFPETSPDNIEITNGSAYIAVMSREKRVPFYGVAWSGEVELEPGYNFLSVPLAPEKPWRLSDLMDFIGEEVEKLILLDQAKGEFVGYERNALEDSSSDVFIRGGCGYIVVMSDAKKLTFTGTAWSDKLTPEIPAGPTLPVKDKSVSPLLVVEGRIRREDIGTPLDGLRVAVRNLTRDSSKTDTTGGQAGPGAYIVVFADLPGNEAVRVGDVLEISVTDPESVYEIKRIRYVIGPDDIRLCKISIPEICLSPIIPKTVLLQNYPNPFNPETWIPFTLSKPEHVVISIYDVKGHLIRKLYLGKRKRGVYLSKSRAAYWDGRNEKGEEVASGVYFYLMEAGRFKRQRKMVLVR